MTAANGSSDPFSRAHESTVSATYVEVTNSAVRDLDAEQAHLERSAVNRLNASQVEASRSAFANARFEQGTIRQSAAGAIIGKSVACDEVHSGILAAPVVRGEVHTWLDLRTAVAIGVGMVLGKALLGGGRALVRKLFS